MMLTTEPTQQIAFCHVPKSSSTTWMNAFGSMNHIETGSIGTYRQVASPNISIHATTYYDMKLLNELPQFKFIFVRHPFERLGSQFQIYYKTYYPNKPNKEQKKLTMFFFAYILIQRCSQLCIETLCMQI